MIIARQARAVPKGGPKDPSVVQPSLRDLSIDRNKPGVKTPGYYQQSLQDEESDDPLGACGQWLTGGLHA
ncbi:MAG TPA: hypothetical protein VGR78_02060 [Verrucomicrobiae bacterium]|nr:hypothetical protein [Verrucomicrobiae bacterium]